MPLLIQSRRELHRSLVPPSLIRLSAFSFYRVLTALQRISRRDTNGFSRIQKASRIEGETAFSRFMSVTTDLFKNEGPKALYKGITPRVLRVAPGQAIVFTVSCFLHPPCVGRLVGFRFDADE
jgi:hypothetical protein